MQHRITQKKSVLRCCGKYCRYCILITNERRGSFYVDTDALAEVCELLVGQRL